MNKLIFFIKQYLKLLMLLQLIFNFSKISAAQKYDYEITSILDSGSEKTVYKGIAIQKKNGKTHSKKVAISIFKHGYYENWKTETKTFKKINKRKNELSKIAKTSSKYKSIDLEKRSSHYVIRMIESIKKFKYNNHVSPAIITELRGENLAKFITENSLSLKEKLSLIKHITMGVYFLHKNNILHQDLKPENIVINKTKSRDIPEIIDLSTSIIFPPNAISGVVEQKPIANPSYISKDKLESESDSEEEGMIKQTVSYKDDIYALGYIFLYILTERDPFEKFWQDKNIEEREELKLDKLTDTNSQSSSYIEPTESITSEESEWSSVSEDRNPKKTDNIKHKSFQLPLFTFNTIKEAKINNWKPELPKQGTPEACLNKIIEQCLNNSPKRRPSAKTLLKLITKKQKL